MSYYFIKKPSKRPVLSDTQDVTTIRFKIDTWDTNADDLAEEFEHFLKACGFEFEGHLEFVSDDLEFVSDATEPTRDEGGVSG